MTIKKIADGLPEGFKKPEKKAPQKVNLNVGNPNHAELGLQQYRAQLYPTKDGLVILHKGIVQAKGIEPPDCYMEFEFEIAAAEQDDLGLIERKWKKCIEALRAEFAMRGIFVTMDIRIPMYVVKKMQGKMPKNIKEAVESQSAPPSASDIDGSIIV